MQFAVYSKRYVWLAAIVLASLSPCVGDVYGRRASHPVGFVFFWLAAEHRGNIFVRLLLFWRICWPSQDLFDRFCHGRAPFGSLQSIVKAHICQVAVILYNSLPCYR